MPKKEVISTFQMHLLLCIGIISTGILTLPAPLYHYAQQNMWLSLFIGSIAGYVMILINVFFYKTFPRKNITEITTQLLGKFFGRLILLIMIALLIFQAVYTIKEYQIYLSVGFYQFTSPFVIIGFMMLVCAYASKKGIEVIGRSAQIILPFMLLFYLSVSLLITPEVSLSNMLPVLEKGVMPPIKGAILVVAWFSEFFWISFCLTSLTDPPKKILKYGFLSVFLTTISLLVFFVIDIGVLGNYTGQTLYPTHLVERYIQIGTFIERVSAFFMSVWVLGMFIKLAFLCFVIIQSSSQLFHISNYRHLIIPIVIMIFFLSLSFFTSTQSLLVIGFPLLIMACQIGNVFIPITLFFIALLKVKMEKQQP